MNIIVCVKQVPDPEIPLAKFRIDPDAKRVIPPEGIPPVISPFDTQVSGGTRCFHNVPYRVTRFADY